MDGVENSQSTGICPDAPEEKSGPAKGATAKENNDQKEQKKDHQDRN